ncbi:hypothetical protein NP116_14960 [Salmonella enterica]|nr:hypothetical protein [Salmonella enterica]
MTTNNHPAHGPVSLDRLHQISEILSKASAQSDGGNLGYAMADAVKVIGGAIAAFGAEPVAYMRIDGEDVEYNGHNEFSGGGKGVPLYTTPPATDLLSMAASAIEDLLEHTDPSTSYYSCVWADVPGKLRTAMLQAGNHTEQHLDMVDHSGDANKMVTGNSPVITDCSCRTCRPVTFTDSRFVVCPECGNKRCPHANDHRNACTGSNEPGQEGSAYPAAQQQK